MSNGASPNRRKDEASSASGGTKQTPSKQAGTPTDEILPCPSSSSGDVVQPKVEITKEEHTGRSRKSVSLGIIRRLSTLRMRLKRQKTCPVVTQLDNVRR